MEAAHLAKRMICYRPRSDAEVARSVRRNNARKAERVTKLELSFFSWVASLFVPPDRTLGGHTRRCRRATAVGCERPARGSKS